MSGKIAGAAFGTTIVAIYLTLGIPALLLLPIDDPLSSLGLALLHECLALGVAMELAELLFGLFLRRRAHSRVPVLDRGSIRVAVLYLCCDDVDVESMASLKHLQNVDVFVLDDSKTAEARQFVDHSGSRVIRRADRHGFKAGNLNHWLCAYGQNYDYFVVLDSDSLMTSEAVWELVAYAEASENRDVAIVQSRTIARPGNRFQTYLAIPAPMRNRILLRLYDAIGWTLSHGHNNLHRTAAIRSTGGFDTTASCEDTATSLRLLREGWRVILVETTTLDAEPRDVVSFRRRYMRWARQTVDVISAMKVDVPLSLALLMTRHALAYLLPIVGIVSLALALGGATAIVLPVSERTYMLGAVSAWTIPGSLLTILILRISLCVQAGGRLRSFFPSMVLSGALIAFCGVHTALGMLRSLARERVGFTPTGATTTLAPTLPRLFRAMAAPWIAYAAVAVLAVWNAPSGAGALQVFWGACFVGSPLLLWFFHREWRR
jgi:cellulose synthase/poly-beta-1,6-N-acetylglucosamine synthase-like glycosyltransferase